MGSTITGRPVARPVGFQQRPVQGAGPPVVSPPQRQIFGTTGTPIRSLRIVNLLSDGPNAVAIAALSAPIVAAFGDYVDVLFLDGGVIAAGGGYVAVGAMTGNGISGQGKVITVAQFSDNFAPVSSYTTPQPTSTAVVRPLIPLNYPRYFADQAGPYTIPADETLYALFIDRVGTPPPDMDFLVFPPPADYSVFDAENELVFNDYLTNFVPSQPAGTFGDVIRGGAPSIEMMRTFFGL